MKKSSYIILGFLGSIILLAFLIPAFGFRNIDNPDIIASDSEETIDLPASGRIWVMYQQHVSGDYPDIIIKPAPEGAKPVARVNKVWMKHTKFEFNDTASTIELRLVADRHDSWEYNYESMGRAAITLEIPEDMLSDVGTGARTTTTLQDFQGVSADIRHAGAYYLQNCDFAALTLRGGRGDDYRLYLDNLSCIGSLQDRYVDLTIVSEGDAMVDTLTVIPGEYGTDVNIDGANIGTFINSPGNTANVTVLRFSSDITIHPERHTAIDN